MVVACTATPIVKHSGRVPTNEPKDIFVNLSNDPDLVALDVQAALQARGFRVALSTGEAKKSQAVISGNTITTYDQVSESKFRYELIISYIRGGYPYLIKWRAVLRDRTENKVLGTYKYDFNAAYQSLGWSNEKIIEDMIETLVVRSFS